MSITPNDYVSAPDLVAAAREFIRSESDGCVVGIHQLLDELSDKFGDRFPVSRNTYEVLDLIETLWADPHVDQVPHGWIEFAWSGLRLGYGLIGIDVDAYESKTGGRTLKEAESRWGPMPPTYRSSSRIEDEVSGIRVFRGPVGVYFRGAIGFKELDIGDIEVVQPHHRVVIAWPSIHPKTGQQYRWFGPDGTLLPEGEVPRVEDLPELPEAWVTALAKDSVREEFFDGSAPNRPKSSDAVVDEEVYEGLTHLTDNGAPDEVVAEVADGAAGLDRWSRQSVRHHPRSCGCPHAVSFAGSRRSAQGAGQVVIGLRGRGRRHAPPSGG
jgi:hypothetical protein